MSDFMDHPDSGSEERLRLLELGNEILENCLGRIGGNDDPRQALEELFSYLGQATGSDRAFIFEKNLQGTTVSNTLEWCRVGVRPQQELLQNLPAAETQQWFTMLEKDHYFTIEDLEDLRQTHPLLYTCLRPQGIRSGAAARVVNGDKLVGFWGFDNPAPEKLPALRFVIFELERIVSAQIARCNLLAQIQNVDLLDPVTGFFNMKALYVHQKMEERPSSMAVIYGRFSDDAESHRLIQGLKEMGESVYNLMNTRQIYRISATEFVAVYLRTDREKIDRRRRALKLQIGTLGWNLQIGSAWSDIQPLEADELIREAMRWSCLYDPKSHDVRAAGDDPLYQYLEKNYFDLEFFLKGLSHNNESACFFFGDIQQNVFYLSENMRRRFGFSSNLIPQLMYAWEERIVGQRAKSRYWKGLREIRDNKLDFCHFYHQVADASGSREWIHMYGEFKWNEDHTQLQFCTGRIIMQDRNLAMDDATHFSLDTILAQHLVALKQQQTNCYFIGFSLNGVEKINDMEGRAFGNSLLRSIAEELAESLGDRASFYKLSGVRFAAMLRPDAAAQREKIIEEIRRVIEDKYSAIGIRLPNAASFVLTRYPQENLEPLDFIESLTSCIRLVQQEGSTDYMDATAIDIEQVRANANQSMDLIRDVLSQMRNFRMVVQPVVETQDSRIKGGEALLRWHNGGRDVSPAFFIPILEQENMMIRVGRWVFEESVKACRRMLSLSPDFKLSINVSLQQLEDEGLMDFITNTIEKYQVDGSHLILEMTESCMDTAQEKLTQFVLFCTEHGITVSLDDFGTGYSSIRVLMQYPTTIIKLDRSLLLEMGKSMDKKNFIASIVFACHQFGKRVCIEGVETNEQDQMVREASCDMIQGFYYYRPMELDDVYSLLARQHQHNDIPEVKE